MKIALAIFISILLWYFWIWLIQHIFAKQEKKISRKLFWTSFLLVWSLLAFNFIINAIFPNVKIYNEQISFGRLCLFLPYCGLIFLFLILLSKTRKKKQIRFLFLIRMLLFAIVGFFGLKIWISATILYYFILAYSEEFLKIWATENEVSKTDFYSSDLLFFSIFIALGFSIIENLFYLWREIFSSNQNWIWWLIFWRWIFASLLHFIATVLIALILYRFYQQRHLKDLNIRKKIWIIILKKYQNIMIMKMRTTINIIKSKM